MTIIKNALIVVLFVGALSSAFGQGVGFGVKGGLNLSTLNLKDPEASYESRTGYHLGLFLRGKFDKVALQP